MLISFHGRWPRWLLVLAVWALLCPTAPAHTVLDLDAAHQPVQLGDRGDYRLDEGSPHAPEEVALWPDASWSPTLTHGIYPLKAGQTLWVRFAVQPTPGQARWHLEIPYPALDRATLYSLDPAGQWLEHAAGDLVANRYWPHPHRHPILPLTVSAEAPTRYLLRIENAQGFSAPLRFVDENHLLAAEQAVSTTLGMYFGMALLGALAGLAGAIVLRDPVYLYFAASSLLMGMTQVAWTGVGAVLLWPTLPFWADRAPVVLVSWAFAAMLLLDANVVSVSQRSRRLYAGVRLLAAVGVTVAISLLLTPSAWRFALVLPYLVSVPLVIAGLNLWAWRRGDRFGLWMTLAGLPFALAVVLAILRYVEWIPASFITEYGILLSQGLVKPAVFAVLLVRSQARRENQLRIRGLDRLDPATGLINAMTFNERMGRMIARARRLRMQCAVMLIEVVNAAQIRRDFGHRSGQDLAVLVAGRLLETVREIDSVARLDGLRFGMLLEGPLTPKGAATLAPKVIARCLMPYRNKPPEWVVKVRIAYALVPMDGSDPVTLLRDLELLLATSPHDDKKTILTPLDRPRRHDA